MEFCCEKMKELLLGKLEGVDPEDSNKHIVLNASSVFKTPNSDNLTMLIGYGNIITKNEDGSENKSDESPITMTMRFCPICGKNLITEEDE